MPESQSRSSSEDHSTLASLWPICSILSMSRKLQTCTFTMFFTVPHASRCASSCVHHSHILNFSNFILFHFKFIEFKPKIKYIKFELHIYEYGDLTDAIRQSGCVHIDTSASTS